MLIQLGVIKGKAATAVAEGTVATKVGAANTAKVGFPKNVPLLIAFAAQAVGIMSAIKAATNATKKISTPSFFMGGHTGENALYNDNYGKVVGVVHDNEWVAPKFMTESPQYAPTIQWLEKERKKELGQFFEGGNTSETSTLEFTENSETSTEDNPMMVAIVQLLQKLDSKLDQGFKGYVVRDYEDYLSRKEIDQEHEQIFNNSRA